MQIRSTTIRRGIAALALGMTLSATAGAGIAHADATKPSPPADCTTYPRSTCPSTWFSDCTAAGGTASLHGSTLHCVVGR